MHCSKAKTSTQTLISACSANAWKEYLSAHFFYFFYFFCSLQGEILSSIRDFVDEDLRESTVEIKCRNLLLSLHNKFETFCTIGCKLNVNHWTMSTRILLQYSIYSIALYVQCRWNAGNERAILWMDRRLAFPEPSYQQAHLSRHHQMLLLGVVVVVVNGEYCTNRWTNK